jgi:hypothetical protein
LVDDTLDEEEDEDSLVVQRGVARKVGGGLF